MLDIDCVKMPKIGLPLNFKVFCATFLILYDVKTLSLFNLVVDVDFHSYKIIKKSLNNFDFSPGNCWLSFFFSRVEPQNSGLIWSLLGLILPQLQHEDIMKGFLLPSTATAHLLSTSTPPPTSVLLRDLHLGRTAVRQIQEKTLLHWLYTSVPKVICLNVTPSSRKGTKSILFRLLAACERVCTCVLAVRGWKGYFLPAEGEHAPRCWHLACGAENALRGNAAHFSHPTFCQSRTLKHVIAWLQARIRMHS